jgi:hypothetical protein
MPHFPFMPLLSDCFRFTDQFLSRSLLDSARSTSYHVVTPNRQVFDILEMLFSISEAISMHQLHGNRELISNSIYLVEYKLVTMNFSGGIEEQQSNRIELSKILGLAAHLFLHLGIREIPIKARRHQVLFQRLSKFLPYEWNLWELNASQLSLKLLLWSVFIAGASVFEDSSRYLLIFKLKELCSILKIHDRVDFEKHLKTILWLEPFCSSLAGELWNDMTQSLASE